MSCKFKGQTLELLYAREGERPWERGYVCHTERNFLIVLQLSRSLFDSGRNVTRVCVHMHACVREVPRVCVCMHACVDWYGLDRRDHGRREAKYARAHS